MVAVDVFVVLKSVLHTRNLRNFRTNSSPCSGIHRIRTSCATVVPKVFAQWAVRTLAAVILFHTEICAKASIRAWFAVFAPCAIATIAAIEILVWTS